MRNKIFLETIYLKKNFILALQKTLSS